MGPEVLFSHPRRGLVVSVEFLAWALQRSDLGTLGGLACLGFEFKRAPSKEPFCWRGRAAHQLGFRIQLDSGLQDSWKDVVPHSWED